MVQTPDPRGMEKAERQGWDLKSPDSAIYLNSGGSLLGRLRRKPSLPVTMGSFGAPVCTSSLQMGILKKQLKLNSN